MAEQLARFAELGSTDVIIRIMPGAPEAMVRSVELAGEVRSRLAAQGQLTARGRPELVDFSGPLDPQGRPATPSVQPILSVQQTAGREHTLASHSRGKLRPRPAARGAGGAPWRPPCGRNPQDRRDAGLTAGSGAPPPAPPAGLATASVSPAIRPAGWSPDRRGRPMRTATPREVHGDSGPPRNRLAESLEGGDTRLCECECTPMSPGSLARRRG